MDSFVSPRACWQPASCCWLGSSLTPKTSQAPQPGPQTEKRFPPLSAGRLQGHALRLRSAHRVPLRHRRRAAAGLALRRRRLHDRPGRPRSSAATRSAWSRTPTATATPTRRPSSPTGFNSIQGLAYHDGTRLRHARAVPDRAARHQRRRARPTSAATCSPAWACRPRRTRSGCTAPTASSSATTAGSTWRWATTAATCSGPRATGSCSKAAASSAAGPTAATCTSSPPACATSTTSPSTRS